ncbi:MAG: hypothetical protein H7Y04_03305, partial [Verrucomicrobia bacterium]|nr:hypothetical protein [Cytophagales bacterium]
MDNNFIDKLKDLRQRIPIGMQHGLLLLEQAKGDINQAEKLFQKETLLEVVKEAKVTEEVAIIHLAKCNYDTYLTINSIDEERYSYTERVLKKFSKDRFTALERIAGRVEYSEEIQGYKGDFEFNIEQLDRLQPEVFCLILVIEWLNYEDYEGFDYAIY